MENVKRYKTTTFNPNYKPKFSDFKKSYALVIPLAELEDAYTALTGKDISKKEKNELQKEIDGNTSTATPEGSEADASTSK